MARLDFDFHAAPTRPKPLGLALLLAGTAALAWSAHTWQAARDTEAGLELRIAALDNVPSPATPRPAPGDAAAQAARAQVASQLAWHWQPAFAALASTRTARIALVSVDASQAKSQLKLVAEARTLDDAIAWIGRLQRQAGVRRATLVQHEVHTDSAERPLRIVVQVELAG
jgi:hypothetical protein